MFEFIIVFLIWIIAFALNDYILQIKTPSILMIYGGVVYAISSSILTGG